MISCKHGITDPKYCEICVYGLPDPIVTRISNLENSYLSYNELLLDTEKKLHNLQEKYDKLEELFRFEVSELKKLINDHADIINTKIVLNNDKQKTQNAQKAQKEYHKCPYCDRCFPACSYYLL